MLSKSSLEHSSRSSRWVPSGALLLGLAFLLVGGLLLVGHSPGHAQEGGSSGTSPVTGSSARQPLDLPSGGRGDEDDEDPPETIQFYGEAYEGDGFFWCLDRSGSMSVDGRLEELKVEVTAALSSLSDSAEIGLVSFSDSHTAWRGLPVVANPAATGSASAWVNSLEAGGLTCLGPAGVKTIEIANLCDKESKQIIVVSDGLPYCGGQDASAASLQSFHVANWQKIPVNTVFIGADDDAANFMRALAAYGGTFRQVGL